MVNIISLEGLIGCGKSTVIEQLKNSGYNAYTEPISDWSLLRHFYKDQRKYAGPMQMQILCSYHKLYENICARYLDPDCTVIIERSPWTSRHIFADMQRSIGNISDVEMSIYESYYDKIAFKPNGFIYMRTDPARAYDRYIFRNRESEDGLNFEYMNTLSETHDRVMSSLDNCTVVDANVEKYEIYDAVVDAIDYSIFRMKN